MLVSPLTSYSLNKTNYNHKVTNPISFGKSEKETVDKYVKALSMIMNTLDDGAVENPDLLVKDFFRRLRSESDFVKAKCILDNHFLDYSMNAFDCALVLDNSLMARELWNFVKTFTKHDVVGSFLFGDVDIPEQSAYVKAVLNNQTALAKDMLNFIDKQPNHTLTERFYKMKSPTKENSNIYENQYEYLARKGYVASAEEFKRHAQNLGIDIKSNKPTDKVENTSQIRQLKEPKNHKVFDEVKTRFSDVGGMFNVKKQIENEFLSILKNPKVKNSDKPSGIILYGPPGTGKTLLATAIAGEAGVPFVSTEGSSFVELYVGSGALNVRKLYKDAREAASAHPSKTAIVFIDEVDAVGGARGEKQNSEHDSTLNALLCEMDGVKAKENDDIKIITIIATNRKDLLDTAFRKGRIDLEFKIDDPRFSEKARYEILSVHAKDKPFKSEEEKQTLLKNLASSTSGFSGAELADVVKRAFRKTLYLGRQNAYITADDLNNSKLESMVGISNDVEDTEYERRTTISHEAGHAINIAIMNKIFGNDENFSKRPVRVLDMIVNDSRGDSAGSTFYKPSDKNSRITIESLISTLVSIYGGYSTEEAIYGCHTDGVSGDLESATNYIFNAITRYGLGTKTKHLCVKPGGEIFDLYKFNIKEDLELYSGISMKISNMIAEFTKPFIEKYTDKYLNNPVKVISGEEFVTMFDEWLNDASKKSELNNLCNNIKTEVEDLRRKITSVAVTSPLPFLNNRNFVNNY